MRNNPGVKCYYIRYYCAEKTGREWDMTTKRYRWEGPFYSTIKADRRVRWLLDMPTTLPGTVELLDGGDGPDTDEGAPCHELTPPSKKKGHQADLSGRKIGRLTVLQCIGRKGGTNLYFRCQCECGKIKDVRGSHLNSGETRSCGCLQRESLRVQARPAAIRRHSQRSA